MITVVTKNSKGFFGRNQKFKRFFRPKPGDLKKKKKKKKKKKDRHPKNVMKSGVSPQILPKYRWQTPIWASLCTPVAPSVLIFSGHSPRLGAQFSFGGHKQTFGGVRPRNAPRGAGPGRIAVCFHSET